MNNIGTPPRNGWPVAFGCGSGAINVQKLTMCFGSTVALDDVTVTVPAGVLTMIVGPPGCGKTVLMKSLSCELEWGAGTIWIQDVPARLWPSKKREAYLCTCPAGRGPGCPFSNSDACPLPQSDAANSSGVREALRLLGVQHLEKRCGPGLSDRDRRRLELAYTLAPFLIGSDQRCVHLWLDDPLEGIDTLHQHRLLQWLRETSGDRQTTMVTATDHTMAHVYAEHSILLAQGRVISEGPPQRALRSDYLSRAFGDPT